jgi:uncharacterized Fe-S center protein
MKSSAKLYHVPSMNDKQHSVTAMQNILEHREYHLFSSFFRKQIIGLFISCKQTENELELLFPFVKEAATSLKKKDTWSFICDTSNRHKDIDSNALQQIEQSSLYLEDMKKILPCFMLDGINGNYEFIAKGSDRKTEVFLGGEIPNLDGLLIFSVPQVHDLCGIAGSLFCMGAGLASKRGKIKLYSEDKPQVNVSKCYGCRRCLHECPVNAIKMGDRHVRIDNSKCVDCGRCVEIAKRCGISYNWNATPDYFQKKMLYHAETVGKVLKNKLIFISIIPLKDDRIEVLISKDPVASDKATLKIIKKYKAFKKENLDIFEKQIQQAIQLGIGNEDFKQEDIAY